jgi:hypothetical protein
MLITDGKSFHHQIHVIYQYTINSLWDQEQEMWTQVLWLEVTWPDRATVKSALLWCVRDKFFDITLIIKGICLQVIYINITNDFNLQPHIQSLCLSTWQMKCSFMNHWKLQCLFSFHPICQMLHQLVFNLFVNLDNCFGVVRILLYNIKSVFSGLFYVFSILFCFTSVSFRLLIHWFLVLESYEKFEDIKGVIRCPISRKGRQYNANNSLVVPICVEWAISNGNSISRKWNNSSHGLSLKHVKLRILLTK